MRDHVILTGDQAYTLMAFLESFDLRTTGVWRQVAESMIEDFAITNPETALAEARDALQS